MKKTVRVITEKEYEIELRPNVLTQEFVDGFESYMWELDGDTLDEKINELFKIAASQIANGEEHFVEGIGPIASVRTVDLKEKHRAEPMHVVWKDTYEDVETEIVN